MEDNANIRITKIVQKKIGTRECAIPMHRSRQKNLVVAVDVEASAS